MHLGKGKGENAVGLTSSLSHCPLPFPKADAGIAFATRQGPLKDEALKKKGEQTIVKATARCKLQAGARDANKVISKSWLVGFTEAEGSFYLVQKGKERLVHAFELTQKLDKIVLEGIAQILHMNVMDKKTYSTVVTYKKTTILHIIDYYRDTMKGMKSLEFRIWSRSFSKKKQDYATLLKTREFMRSIGSIRLDKNFKIKE